MMFLKGKNLWDEINKELPQAHGVIEDDIPRMEAFNKLKETFLPKEKQALRIFLNREIYEWDHNFCEITSGLQEQYERRQLQIYRQHLAALNGSEWP